MGDLLSSGIAEYISSIDQVNNGGPIGAVGLQYLLYQVNNGGPLE